MKKNSKANYWANINRSAGFLKSLSPGMPALSRYNTDIILRIIVQSPRQKQSDGNAAFKDDDGCFRTSLAACVQKTDMKHHRDYIDLSIRPAHERNGNSSNK